MRRIRAKGRCAPARIGHPPCRSASLTDAGSSPHRLHRRRTTAWATCSSGFRARSRLTSICATNLQAAQRTWKRHPANADSFASIALCHLQVIRFLVPVSPPQDSQEFLRGVMNCTPTPPCRGCQGSCRGCDSLAPQSAFSAAVVPDAPRWRRVGSLLFGDYALRKHGTPFRKTCLTIEARGLILCPPPERA